VCLWGHCLVVGGLWVGGWIVGGWVGGRMDVCMITRGEGGGGGGGIR